MMRMSRKYMAVGLIASLFVTGCQDDELVKADAWVEEGIPTQVRIGYISEESTLETRAAQTPEYERRIENIYLFVFNSAGQRQTLYESVESDVPRSGLFIPGGAGGGGLYPEGDNVNNGKGNIQFVCGSLNDATIVAIANVTNAEVSTAYTLTPNELDAIQTLGELQDKVMYMNTESVRRGALFMMTGYAEDGAGHTEVDIVGNESGTPLGFSLQLERTDAKVEVNVISNPGNAAWTDFQFTPQSWQVVNVPKQSLILPTETGDADDETCTYFSTTPTDFETFDTEGTGGGGFVFYMPENRKTPKKLIDMQTGTKEEQYALREQWSTEEHTDPTRPGQTVENTGFTNAPGNATYLLITGRLSYKDGSASVEATTRYYVHLGYADANPNDYETKRNYHYIYNITVQGVNQITVDVTKNQDERPGHEGDVIRSEHPVYELDCHYDRCLLEIYPEDIIISGVGETTWAVSTPFCSPGGIYNPSNQSVDGIEDYRWIKFAINGLYNVNHGEYAAYPGDQCYHSDFVPTSGTLPTEGGKYYLLDINQLVAYLKLVKQSDSDLSSLKANGTPDGHICITAFVDEYVYTQDPTDPNAQKDLSLWKRFVNQDDRQLHIISRGQTYSNDGMSSLTNSLYTFRQKAIRTMYNLDSDVETAWGLESDMETGRLQVGSIPSSATSTSNGRWNTLRWLGNSDLHWSDVVDKAQRYALNTSYQNALYACVLRNRDLDGDDIIDPEEIRWYLASINQLTDMYIGEYALDVNSRLYPWNPVEGTYPPEDGHRPNGKNRVYWHYTSSTYDSNGNPFVVWAEEGASKGNFGASSSNNGSYYAYRCVRNLGIDITSTATEPTDFVQVQDYNDYYEFDLSYLAPQALREYYVEGGGTYTPHHEKTEHNLPYWKFRVSKSLYPTPNYRVDNIYDWDYFQTYRSGVGYRVPNMRELLILMSRKGDKLYEHWKYKYDGYIYKLPNPLHVLSYTSFSMKYSDPYTNDGRQGYSYNTKDGSMGPGDNEGYAPGVRDVN